MKTLILLFLFQPPAILNLVNQHRLEMGLKPLVMMKQISEQSALHSRDMAEGKLPFGHQGLGDRKDSIEKQIGFIQSWAENVASGQNSAKEVVNDWLNSPGHRKIIEGNFNYTGIGIAEKNGYKYYTEMFILK